MGEAADDARWHGLWWEWALLNAMTAAVLSGAGLRLTGHPDAADLVWAVVAGVGLAPAVWWAVRSAMRRRFGVDAIVVVALAVAIAVGEELAGAIVALMLVVRAALEAYTRQFAFRDLRRLIERAPRGARRQTAQGVVEMVELSAVCPDDHLLVEPGEVVAVDGFAVEPAVLDESAVTGLAEPVDRGPGDRVASGAVNAGPAFSMRATATATQSTYAGMVRLAREATWQRASMLRMTDRAAIAFIPLALLIAGIAWAVSGDPSRVVAVLVVATPGPLLLVAPVAIVCGLSRTARRGVVIRDGGALEDLGRARTLLIDKTGTLTVGRPRVTEMVSAPGTEPDEMLRLAASIEQLSPHALAAAVVGEAARHGLPLSAPEDVREEPGRGISGRVDGRMVQVGRLAGDLTPWAEQERQRAELDGAAVVWVCLDGEPVGALLVQDPVRTDARRSVRRLREAGFARLVMVTGDRPRVADEVARVIGVDDVMTQCTAQEKVDRVRDETRRAFTVMVGDGLRDQPALAAADVGVSLGATGASAPEPGDGVLTVDRVDRMADAAEISRHSQRVGLLATGAGMVLALAAMSIAAAGLLAPVYGALVRQGIDVAALAGALAVLIGGVRRRPLPAEADELIDQFAVEHERLRDALSRLRNTADMVATEHDGTLCVDALRDAHTRLSRQILRHDEAEEQRLYPAVTGPLGGSETTATMTRAHTEIRRLVERVDGHLCQASDSQLRADQVPDLLATLYGLDAILRLHFAEEEENLFSLTSASQPVTVGSVSADGYQGPPNN